MVSPCYLAAKGCGDNGTLAECCWNNGLTQEKNKAGTSSRLLCTSVPAACTVASPQMHCSVQVAGSTEVCARRLHADCILKELPDRGSPLDSY